MSMATMVFSNGLLYQVTLYLIYQIEDILFTELCLYNLLKSKKKLPCHTDAVLLLCLLNFIIDFLSTLYSLTLLCMFNFNNN